MKVNPKNFYAYKMELFKKTAGLKILLSIPKTLTDLKKKKKENHVSPNTSSQERQTCNFLFDRARTLSS